MSSSHKTPWSQQRTRDGRNENATAQQFLDSTIFLHIQKSPALEPVRGSIVERGQINQIQKEGNIKAAKKDKVTCTKIY